MCPESAASLTLLLCYSCCSFLWLVVLQESLCLYGLGFKLFQYFFPVACCHFFTPSNIFISFEYSLSSSIKFGSGKLNPILLAISFNSVNLPLSGLNIGSNIGLLNPELIILFPLRTYVPFLKCTLTKLSSEIGSNTISTASLLKNESYPS